MHSLYALPVCGSSLSYVLPSPIYVGLLAARVSVAWLHSQTKPKFSEAVTNLHEYRLADGRGVSLIGDEVFEFIMAHKDALDTAIVDERDHSYGLLCIPDPVTDPTCSRLMDRWRSAPSICFSACPSAFTTAVAVSLLSWIPIT